MAWKANPEVMVQRMGESMLLVNLATDRIIQLNETAAMLFELLSSGLDEAEIEVRLAAEFGVGRDVVRGEMPAILSSLAEEQAVIASG